MVTGFAMQKFQVFLLINVENLKIFYIGEPMIPNQ